MHLRLSAGRGSVATARHWARERAQACRLPISLVPVVELLTSELVANAVAHGSGPTIEVRLSCDGRHLTVEVTDDGDDLPMIRETGPEVVGGQGMRLVDRLAESWGVEPFAGGGKTVWFTVAAVGAAAAGAGTTAARFR